MGVFKVTPKSGGSVVMENPQKKITQEMARQGRIFALYTRDGEFIVDHFNKPSTECKPDMTQAFYLAVNLNFIQDFGNSVKVGVYNQAGTEQISPNQASFKLAFHLGDDAVVHTNSKNQGSKVNVSDYEDGILLTTLKLPKDWQFAAGNQLRVRLQSSLMFNPGELETFVLKLSV